MATNSWSSIQNLIIGDSGSGKTNSLFNLINEEPDIDKIYLYAKDQFLFNKRESTCLKHFDDSKFFIEYWDDVDVIKALNTTQIRNVKVKLFLIIWLLICLVIKNLIQY